MPSTSEVIALFDSTAIALLLTTVVVFSIPIFILFPPIPVEHGDALQQTHSKVGIPASESNLRDQTSPEHNYQPDKAGKIQSLLIYPVKSCQGIEVTKSKIFAKGFEFDRLFTFARQKASRTVTSGEEAEQPNQPKKPQWEILTLRQVPLLANVQVDLWLPDASKTSRQLGRVGGRFIVVRFPWKDSGLRGTIQWISAKLSRGFSGIPEKEFMLSIDFPPPGEIKTRGYQYEDTRFFEGTVHALNLRNEVPPELARYLGVNVPTTIFMIDPAQRRQVFRNAPRKEDLGYQPMADFQDVVRFDWFTIPPSLFMWAQSRTDDLPQYPLNVLSLTSVRALESKVQKDDGLKFLDARRFRPNIIGMYRYWLYISDYVFQKRPHPVYRTIDPHALDVQLSTNLM